MKQHINHEEIEPEKLNVLCTFNLRPVPTGLLFTKKKKLRNKRKESYLYI